MENIKKSYKGLTGFWTKWGGRVYGMADAPNLIPQDWVCQSCGDSYPAVISPFKFEYPQGEYIRCCGICFAEKCIAIAKRIIEERI